MTLLVGNRPKTKDQRPKTIFGFTLIELLLVIAIISVLAGVSFPLIKKTIQSTEFKSFSSNAYLFLDYVKTQSMLKNVILKVKIDSNNKQISLVKTNEEDEETVLDTIIAQNRPLKVPEKINIEAEKEEITFYPDGTLQPFKITISDDKGRSIVVYSKGIDGKIVVEQ